MAVASSFEEVELELQPPHRRETEEEEEESPTWTTFEDKGRRSTTPSSVGIRTILHSLRTLFFLDQQQRDEDQPDHGNNDDVRMIGGMVGCWVVLIFWFFTGFMGPGVRYLILVEIPGAALFYTVQIAICFCLVKRFRVSLAARAGSASASQNNNKVCWCCILLAGGAWAGVGTLLSRTLPWQQPWIAEHLPGCWLLWALVPVIYGMHWLMQRIMRRLHRQVREEDPSPQFWQRLDTCLVNLLRCLGFLVAITYVAVLVYMVIDSRRTYRYLEMKEFLLEVLFQIFMSTLFLADFMYLLVATLAVHDYGPGGTNNSHNNNNNDHNLVAMRRTRQFVMNPNDPLGEPLLLV